MTIRSTIQVENPDSVEVTLMLTMTLGEWKSVAGELGSGRLPASNLRSAIRNAVGRLDGKISGSEEPA